MLPVPRRVRLVAAPQPRQLRWPCPTSKIDHVVILVQENHTFDNYYGRYCTAAAGSAPTCTQDLVAAKPDRLASLGCIACLSYPHAAEAVGAGGDVAPDDVFDLLTHLVDKSLVEIDAQGERYRLLETVLRRVFAADVLACPGGRRAVRAVVV